MNVNPIDIYVGSKIRMKRTMLGMSQDKLGELTGVTFQQIQKYEKGLNRVGSSRLYEIAQILNVSVGYFFEGYCEEDFDENSLKGMLQFAEEESDDFQYEDLNNKEILNLIRAFRRIKSSNVRKSIISLISSFTNESNSNRNTES